jgi:hypothetical protein
MADVIVRGKKMWENAWQPVTILALAARNSVSDGASDNIYVGDYDNLVVILEITASATDAGDTLDVKLDGSWDGTTYYNMGEFTQQAGNGSAASEIMFFSKGRAEDPNAILVATSDAGATVIRPGMCPPWLRATSVIARVTGVDEEHTFSVLAYVQ